LLLLLLHAQWRCALLLLVPELAIDYSAAACSVPQLLLLPLLLLPLLLLLGGIVCLWPMC